MKQNRIIFHIDVDSAYLSWEAVYRLQNGAPLDLRTIPSAVGGDPKSRHGIILAKSTPAKQYKIQTGETLHNALKKCPSLHIVSPSYGLYMQCSNAMMAILEEYSPVIQRFSVDEVFLDYTDMEHRWGDPITMAHRIKDRIKEELGFTVSIGISSNKLLAKMASDLKKPDAVATVFPEEISQKIWPLPVESLFYVGRATLPKLNKIGIYTIGDLATCDYEHIKYRLKSHGIMIWNYANGREDSPVRGGKHMDMKGIGNSSTIAFDVEDKATAYRILLAITETVSMRLRHTENVCGLVAISLRDTELRTYSHQRKLFSPTDCTKEIFKTVAELFDEAWRREPIRNFGVRVSELSSNEFQQKSLFDDIDRERNKALDAVIDQVRLRYGSTSIMKAVLLNSGIKSMIGGVGADDYPMMASLL
ncbi:DNA polymerase-4 [Anaerosolibacter carboniphilus]|uniref:DNA polymerase IV n=1 Tax=Anaerosolibacter carboniphilus TaxID=1417629 RepID=A0A841KU79_9FIRM|nr:DNA polymerase IV [Anaerosolibacter carboniphilus]MBB6217264.1 DNA polymerase-4 [Anaerosolibacter carboniphilus]